MTKILTVCVVVLLNFSKPKSQFSHPVHAAAHPAGGEVDLGWGGVGPEPIRVEIVAGQILTVIITGNILNVNLCMNDISFKTFSNQIWSTELGSNYKLRYQSKRMITPVMKTYKVQNKLNYVFFTNLVTFFEIIEEKIRVSHVEN